MSARVASIALLLCYCYMAITDPSDHGHFGELWAAAVWYSWLLLVICSITALFVSRTAAFQGFAIIAVGLIILLLTPRL